MISFSLRCGPGRHEFDAWFRSSSDFERQAAAHLVECPVCGSHEVAKALMAPAIGAGDKDADTAGAPRPTFANAEAAKAFAKLQEMARELRAKADYVGPKFADEARRIHYGETPTRQIYGEASSGEIEGLSDEGILAVPLPPLPEDRN